jgi:hypothetical protein
LDPPFKVKHVRHRNRVASGEGMDISGYIVESGRNIVEQMAQE